jgi:ABC-2 type transport system ATP-binding protein
LDINIPPTSEDGIVTTDQTEFALGAVSGRRDEFDSEGSDSRPAIKITHLVKSYGKRGWVTSSADVRNYISLIRGKAKGTTTALDDVNLTVREGEVFGLLGPNGAGKTTLIKILSALITPDAGEVLVYGIDVAKKPRAVLRKLQTVLSQSTGFELRLSGRRNLELYAALYGIRKEEAKRRINSILEFTGLSARADDPFQKYSTGMARKLLVSRALLSDASLLVFDEPTSSLDPVSAMEFREFIRHDLVQQRGKTVFLATHNLHEAQMICDRIALIEKGRIVAVGTPSQVRAMVGEGVKLVFVLGNVEESPRNDLQTGLREVAGLLDLRTEISGDDMILTISGKREIDYNGIFKLLLETNLRVKSVEATEPSLEEAFMSLISEGGE